MCEREREVFHPDVGIKSAGGAEERGTRMRKGWIDGLEEGHLGEGWGQKLKEAR